LVNYNFLNLSALQKLDNDKCPNCQQIVAQVTTNRVEGIPKNNPILSTPAFQQLQSLIVQPIKTQIQKRDICALFKEVVGNIRNFVAFQVHLLEVPLLETTGQAPDGITPQEQHHIFPLLIR
jgi:hypothetical protein